MFFHCPLVSIVSDDESFLICIVVPRLHSVISFFHLCFAGEYDILGCNFLHAYLA